MVPGTLHVPETPDGAPHLIGSRCAGCGATVFPKMAVCPACRRPDTMRMLAMGRTATLYSHTIAHVAPTGFKAPYFQAHVDLPEGPRIFTLISDAVPVEPGRLSEGMALELVVEPVRKDESGKPVLTGKYRPAQR